VPSKNSTFSAVPPPPEEHEQRTAARPAPRGTSSRCGGGMRTTWAKRTTGPAIVSSRRNRDAQYRSCTGDAGRRARDAGRELCAPLGRRWLVTSPALDGTTGRYFDFRRRELTRWFGADRTDWSEELYACSLALCGLDGDPLRAAA
jgi:hypothetical protein